LTIPLPFLVCQATKLSSGPGTPFATLQNDDKKLGYLVQISLLDREWQSALLLIEGLENLWEIGNPGTGENRKIP